jgi:hypothetical protein
MSTRPNQASTRQKCEFRRGFEPEFVLSNFLCTLCFYTQFILLRNQLLVTVIDTEMFPM